MFSKIVVRKIVLEGIFGNYQCNCLTELYLVYTYGINTLYALRKDSLF